MKQKRLDLAAHDGRPAHENEDVLPRRVHEVRDHRLVDESHALLPRQQAVVDIRERIDDCAVHPELELSVRAEDARAALEGLVKGKATLVRSSVQQDNVDVAPLRVEVTS